jgi:hypothetical protein
MDVSRLENASLSSALAPLSNLEEVLRWAFGRSPPGTVAEVVIQDEFTHDVVLALGETWLVFDST